MTAKSKVESGPMSATFAVDYDQLAPIDASMTITMRIMDWEQLKEEIEKATPLHHDQMGRFNRLIGDLLSRVYLHFEKHAPPVYDDVPPDADFGDGTIDHEEEMRRAALDHRGRP